ncbi:hypothetical protein [Streptomyces sp. NPDC014006]
MKVDTAGTIVPDVTYTHPAAMPIDNLEGFARRAHVGLCQGAARSGRER